MGNVNVRIECGNGGILGENVLIGAILGVNVSSECGNVLIGENIEMNVR